MTNYAGFLIRQARLQRNLSQESLAKGICAASYLSKIETGQAEPGAEILSLLFSALGLSFTCSPQALTSAQALWEEYFTHAEFGEDTAPCAQALLSLRQTLEYSTMHLQYHVFLLFYATEMGRTEDSTQEISYLCRFLPYMDATLQFWYYLAAGILEKGSGSGLEAALEPLQAARRCRSCSIVEYYIASAYYRYGDAAQTIEWSERAYRSASDEGNVYQMLWSSFLTATGYTNFTGLALAEKYYRRTAALARGSSEDVASRIEYNLGASYLERGQTDKALMHLRRVRADPDSFDEIMLGHKLTLALQADGQTQQAEEALARATGALAKCRDTLPPERAAVCSAMLRFAELRFSPDCLSLPEYEQVLRQLYDRAGQAFGFGFRWFHGLYLITLYQHQRRYKEALLVAREINSNFPDVT